MTIDLDALEKRLKRTKWTRERNDGPNGNYFDEVCDEDDFGAEESLVNPDGPEAVSTIKALIAELRDARSTVEELLYAHTDKSIAMGESFLARNVKGEG